MQLVRDNNGYWVMAEKSNKTYISLPDGNTELLALEDNSVYDEITPDGQYIKRVEWNGSAYVELAQYEYYNINNSITAYENGTMYVSPALTENYTYNNGITFESKVVTIDSVIDINGDEVEYTLAEDEMSLTITNGVNGDAYHVYGNIEGLTPIIGFEYPTNIKTQVSSLNAGQIKQTSRIMTLEDTLAMLIVQNA